MPAALNTPKTSAASTKYIVYILNGKLKINAAHSTN